MKLLVLALSCLAFALVLAGGRLAAQVPPHYPGTICYTPSFWCWSATPGPMGSRCFCPSPMGWIEGLLG